MQKEYVIQFYKTINKLLSNLSFAGQYMYHIRNVKASYNSAQVQHLYKSKTILNI